MSDFTGETKDGTQGNIEELMRLFPQVVTETKDGNGRLVRSVDFAALRELLGDDTSENDERYDFTWAGKKEAMREAARPTRKTLRPCKEESKNWDTTRNLYIEGDNLEALKILENTYHGQVKMIYIDPPYNTGKDFIYHDDAARSEHEEKIAAGEIDKETDERFTINPETNGRYHSDWCSMMYPRLSLARRLLKDDGVIFISIDDNEAKNVRELCDEVFGECNFIAQIVIDATPKNDPYVVSTAHEYCIVYCRNVEAIKNAGYGVRNPLFDKIQVIYDKGAGDFPRIVEELEKFYSENDLTDDNISNYKYADDKGVYRIGPIDDPQGGGPKDSRINPRTGNHCLTPTGGWRCTLETWKAWKKDGLIVFPETDDVLPSKKTYITQDRLDVMRAYFKMQTRKDTDALKKLFKTEVAPFSNPKPIELIRTFIENCNDRSMTILDFFSGSATTFHATMVQNAKDFGCRKVICVQLQEKIEERSGQSNKEKKTTRAAIKFLTEHGLETTVCEIGKERIRRAGEKILAEWTAKQKSKENELALDGDGDAGVRTLPPDIGFRVFKVSDSNMEDVFYSPTDVTQAMLPGMVNNVKEGRTGLDLLISTRLEWGLSIDCPIDEETVDGKTVFSVDDGQMLACFETGITDAFVKKLAMRKPQFAIFRDVDFKDSAAKINAREIFKAVCGKDAPTEVRFL